MTPKFPRKVKPGDEITADDWNALIDLVRMAMILPGGSVGINVIPQPDGTRLQVANKIMRFLGITDGAISGGSSGTAGTGHVKPVNVDTDGTTLITTSVSYAVINSGPSISSGQYCWVAEYPSGIFQVVSSGGGGGGSLAKTTSTISARSGTTAGSGTVDLYKLSGSTLTTTGTTGVTAYNYSPGTFASGKYCWVNTDSASGKWVITSVEC